MIIEFKELIAEAIDKVEKGDKYAYPVYVELKDLVKFLTDAMSQIEEQVFEEIGDGKMEYEGYQVEKRNGSIRWDFSHIDSIKQLKQQIKDLEVMHKIAYERDRKGLEPIINAETGELIEPAIAKFTKDAIVVSKAKK